METFLIKAAQLILAFAIIVIIHEFGHFFFSRLFGVRVEKFYMFFNPWFSLAKWKPKRYFEFLGKRKNAKNPQLDPYEEEEEEAELKREIDDTPVVDAQEVKPAEKTTAKPAKKKKKASFWGATMYGIGWLPLGGYCKIAGMVDESMDTEQLKREPKEWEFRAKPAWQRLLIMVAGVLFNFLLAILIYAGIVWWWGDDYVPMRETRGMLMYSDVAQKAGFRDGDIPLTADGKEVDNLADDFFDLGSARDVKVLREGKDTVSVSLPHNFPMQIEQARGKDSRGIEFLTLDVPVVVHSINSESSRAAGLRVGDEIVAINDTASGGAHTFMPMLEGRAGQTIDLTVLRREAGRTDTVTFPIKLDGASKIGFQLENDMRKLFNVKTVRYGMLESIPVGVSKGTGKMVDYISSLKYLFTKEGAQSVGGFGAIGNMFPEKWNWFAFWNIAAFLSVALAFMNILPIPALDGGHVLFLLYEVIFRRKPSDKFLERAQVVGMALLLLLLVYANGMDIVRFFVK